MLNGWESLSLGLPLVLLLLFYLSWFDIETFGKLRKSKELSRWTLFICRCLYFVTIFFSFCCCLLVDVWYSIKSRHNVTVNIYPDLFFICNGLPNFSWKTELFRFICFWLLLSERLHPLPILSFRFRNYLRMFCFFGFIPCSHFHYSWNENVIEARITITRRLYLLPVKKVVFNPKTNTYMYVKLCSIFTFPPFEWYTALILFSVLIFIISIRSNIFTFVLVDTHTHTHQLKLSMFIGNVSIL